MRNLNSSFCLVQISTNQNLAFSFKFSKKENQHLYNLGQPNSSNFLFTLEIKKRQIVTILKFETAIELHSPSSTHISISFQVSRKSISSTIAPNLSSLGVHEISPSFRGTNDQGA
jgi:hypothetical protein